MIEENPWLAMWVRPRATIRAIVEQDPKRSLWLLAFIYGFTSLLNGFQSFPIALQFGVIPMLLIAVIFAPFWGYAIFSMWSYVVIWVGRLFKGQATFEQGRAAFAWAAVPLIANIPLWVLLVLFFGDFLFFGAQDQIMIAGPAVLLLFLILIGKLVFAIWSIVIYLQALAEVQQFSVLRAIGNVILASLCIGIAVTILWTAAAIIFNAAAGPGLQPIK